MITLEDYITFFRNFGLRFSFWDCAVASANEFVFATVAQLTEKQELKEEEMGWDPLIRPSGFVLFKKKEKQLRGKEFMDDRTPSFVGAPSKPKEQYIFVESLPFYPSLENRVCVFPVGETPYEDTPLQSFDQGGKSGFLRGEVSRIKTIEGWLYACGGGRSFGKRLGDHSWQSFTQDFELPRDWMDCDDIGFTDFDGFSEQDIYAAGEKGDVWHFDGKRWRQIRFPSDMSIYTVCCGGDGNVYISGDNGLTYVGRDDSWQALDNPQLDWPFVKTVWYEGAVWAANPRGLWVIKDGKIEEADVPDEVRLCAGHVAAGHGILLLAGGGGAAFMESGKWNTIFLFEQKDREYKAAIEAGVQKNWDELDELDEIEDWYGSPW